ncbi:MAG: hypothetical protein C0432_04475 [Candidatus Puniceispirillum sp.]|nr:hypothetical protein [Candidatus Pelagibacter sp.]MBA4283531.1 hypothetical protein [Candidatus Puniceispirillum sp.]
MTKLLSLAAMFALTTSLSFACDAHLDDTACGGDKTCIWTEGKCALKEAEGSTPEAIDCSTRDVSNCAEEDKKCELKPAEGDNPEVCVAVKADAAKPVDATDTASK